MTAAVITGASTGLGAEFTRQLVREFPDIEEFWLIARRVGKLEELAQQFPEKKFVCIGLNLLDPKSFRYLGEKLAEQKVDVRLLVNNAGISISGLFQDLSDAEWNRCLAVNLTGARNMTRAVLPHMLHEHAGCIVNVSSIWGLRGASCEVTYSATKGALIALTRSLASELAPTGIRVNCVAPGVIKTDMLDALPPEVLPQLAQETPLGRLGTPEDIAAAVSFLADEKASFITGQVLTCDGGFIL